MPLYNLGDLPHLQNAVHFWEQTNFGTVEGHDHLLGLMEEVGELAHAHLKARQGIRGSAESHRVAKIDAIGDILIYLLNYCAAEDISLADALLTTWNTVRQRDWKANPQTGVAHAVEG